MSYSGVDVMQKKPDETLVIWREYEALRDHLDRIITRTTDTIDSDATVKVLILCKCKCKSMISKLASRH
jgi:hypothetical protein